MLQWAKKRVLDAVLRENNGDVVLALVVYAKVRERTGHNHLNAAGCLPARATIVITH